MLRGGGVDERGRCMKSKQGKEYVQYKPRPTMFAPLRFHPPTTHVHSRSRQRAAVPTSSRSMPMLMAPTTHHTTRARQIIAHTHRLAHPRHHPINRTGGPYGCLSRRLGDRDGGRRRHVTWADDGRWACRLGSPWRATGGGSHGCCCCCSRGRWWRPRRRPTSLTTACMFGGLMVGFDRQVW